MSRAIFYIIFCLQTCVLAQEAVPTAGEGSLQTPHVLDGVDVKDRSGNSLPLDMKLTDHNGNMTTLQAYFGDNARGLPTILTLGYYQCPMLCSLVLNGLTESLNKIDSLKLGKSFNMISVSIDPRETADLAKSKRVNYLKSVNASDDAPWSFNVAEESEIKRLAEAVGFEYKYIKKVDQYAHGAAVFVISPKGMISRTHWGIAYAPRDLQLSLMDASEEKIGSVLERVLLSCLHYDPDSHTYGLYIFGVMRLGALLTVLALGFFMWLFFSRERNAKKLA